MINSKYFVFLFAGIIKILVLNIVLTLAPSNLSSTNPYIILFIINTEFSFINIITYITANNTITPFIILIPPFNIMKKTVLTPFTN